MRPRQGNADLAARDCAKLSVRLSALGEGPDGRKGRVALRIGVLGRQARWALIAAAFGQVAVTSAICVVRCASGVRSHCASARRVRWSGRPAVRHPMARRRSQEQKTQRSRSDQPSDQQTRIAQDGDRGARAAAQGRHRSLHDRRRRLGRSGRLRQGARRRAWRRWARPCRPSNRVCVSSTTQATSRTPLATTRQSGGGRARPSARSWTGTRTS